MRTTETTEEVSSHPGEKRLESSRCRAINIVVLHARKAQQEPVLLRVIQRLRLVREVSGL
jgi:hypothetical protein